MEKQKNSPALRFAEFTEGWVVKKLGELTSWASGGTPPKDNLSYWNGNIPWISASSMRGLEYSDSELKITNEGLKKGSKLAKKGSLLILVRGSMLFNKIQIGIVTKDVSFNQDVKSIEVNNSSTSKYILYWFISSETKLMNMVTGTGIGAGKLDLDDLKALELNLPSLPEQQKIATFFTAIDKKLSGLKEKKNLLEQYKKGVMQQLFTVDTDGRPYLRFKDTEGGDFAEWEEKRLGEIAEIYDGTHQTPTYVEKGIPFYSVEQITANDFQKTKYVTQDVFEKENKRVKIEKGDILMTRIGDIGTARYIDWDVNASFYVSIVLIKQSQKYNSKYLNQFITTKFFQNELWNRTIHVAFPKKINLGEIGNCIVQLPCLEEQTQIANYLSALDKKIQGVSAQIEKIEMWKKGLLQQMFV